MKRFLIALTMAGVLALPAHAAFADSGQSASGTFKVVSETPVSVQQVGTDCVIHLKVVFSFEGSLVGAFNPPADFLLVQQAPCNQSGPVTFVAAGTFQGTVNGAAGTLNFVFTGALPDPQHAHGTLYILGGTGQLSHASGAIVLTGMPHVGGTYTGSVALGSG
jgi:Protein of unknown function (DUF3224)